MKPVVLCPRQIDDESIVFHQWWRNFRRQAPTFDYRRDGSAFDRWCLATDEYYAEAGFQLDQHGDLVFEDERRAVEFLLRWS